MLLWDPVNKNSNVSQTDNFMEIQQVEDRWHPAPTAARLDIPFP